MAIEDWIAKILYGDSGAELTPYARERLATQDPVGQTPRSSPLIGNIGDYRLNTGLPSIEETLSNYASSNRTSESAPRQTRAQEVDTGNYSVSEYFGGRDTDAYREYQEGKRGGRWDDLPDYISQQGSSEENFVDDLIKQQQDLIDEQTAFLTQYQQDNPFVFDEELARESATQQYEPYYQELLSDYIQEIDLQRVSIEDDRNLQAQLKEFEEGAATRDLTRALASAKEGYAGSGMFFSGNKARAMGETQVESQIAGEKRDVVYAGQEQRRQRREEGLGIDEQRRRRDIARDQEAAIEGGVLQRESEAITGYNVPFIQTYNRRFDPGNISGYTIPEGFRF